MELRIFDAASPMKPVLETINEEAFPAAERCTLDALFATGADGNLEMLAILDGETPIGFFAVRKFCTLRYLAYFAIRKDLRGKGLGTHALQMLQARYTGCQIVTEFELPVPERSDFALRQRRRAFYLRSGFSETGWRTAYDGAEFAIACTEPPFQSEVFAAFIGYLNTIVADHIPNPYRQTGTVTLICGKICCGKTTYAERLCAEKPAVLLSVDAIMLAVFGQHAGEMHDTYTARIKRLLLEQSVALAQNGISSVLDWGFWQRAERAEIRDFYHDHGIPCELHYLPISDALWAERLRKRNQAVSEGRTDAYYVDEALAAKFEALFEAPDASEPGIIIQENP